MLFVLFVFKCDNGVDVIEYELLGTWGKQNCNVGAVLSCSFLGDNADAFALGGWHFSVFIVWKSYGIQKSCFDKPRNSNALLFH